MKTRTYVSILILVLAVLIISEGFAQKKKVIPIEDAVKKLEGVYVNTEHSGYDYYRHPQKRVIFTNGKMNIYTKATNQSPSYQTEYSIEESWSDSTGIIYCKAIVKIRSGSFISLELWKLDANGDVFEVMFNFYYPNEDVSQEYPAKIDSGAEMFPRLSYNIYYRQE
jgi:hypothetical protein